MRFTGFFGAPLVSLVTPLLLLPLLARTVSESEWAAIAVGQSVGGVLALIVAWGWPLYGPAAVASSAPDHRVGAARGSLRERLAVGLALLPIAAVAAWSLTPEPGEWVLTTATAIAGAATGLSFAWYAAGTARPFITVRYELVPRVLAVVAAAALVPLTGVALLYPILLIAACIVGLASFARRELRSARSAGIGRSQRTKAVAMSTELAGGLYSVAVVAVASIGLSTAAVAELSSADRVFRLGTFVIVAAVAALQSYVHAGEGSAVGRQIRAVLVHAGLGVAGGAFLAVAGPFASSVLFGAELTPTWQTFAWYGAAFCALSLNASVGRHVLVVRDRLGAVLVSTVVGSIAGVPLILSGTRSGPAGVALAVFATETLVLGIQLAALAIGRRRRRRATTSARATAAIDARV